MEKVELYVYDLSGGMAKTMSMGLVGKQIDGIWHTSVVIFGKEYCFGQGVEEMIPGTAPYGHPVQKISMGNTEIPKSVFEDYMDLMKKTWTKEKYHLFDNNCNSFSNELCNFLVGRGIPDYITQLPSEFLSTPMGKMLKPMIEGMYGQNAVIEDLEKNSNSLHVKKVSTLKALDSIIQNNKCVVVGISVETSVSRDISTKFKITATPTFIFFLDGKKFFELQGANRKELHDNIQFLLHTAYPPHPHQSLNLRTVFELEKFNGIELCVSSNTDKIFEKLKLFIDEFRPTFRTDDLDTLQNWMKSDYQKAIIVPRDWQGLPIKLLEFLPVKFLFPLLDILRLLAVNPAIKKCFAKSDVLPKLINRILKDENAGNSTILMLLKFATNVFSTKEHHEFEKLIDGVLYREQMTFLIVETILSANPQIRQTSALLVFNFALGSTQVSKKKILYNEHWVSEIMAALCSGYKSEIERDDKADDETGDAALK